MTFGKRLGFGCVCLGVSDVKTQKKQQQLGREFCLSALCMETVSKTQSGTARAPLKTVRILFRWGKSMSRRKSINLRFSSTTFFFFKLR